MYNECGRVELFGRAASSLEDKLVLRKPDERPDRLRSCRNALEEDSFRRNDAGGNPKDALSARRLVCQ